MTSTEKSYKTVVASRPSGSLCVPYEGEWSYRTVCVGDYESCCDTRDGWETKYGCQCSFVEPV